MKRLNSRRWLLLILSSSVMTACLSMPQEKPRDPLAPKENSWAENDKENPPHSPETTNKTTTPQELTPQELTPQELTPQELTPQELTPQELTPQELTPQELTPQELTPQELTPQELTPQELTPQELTPQELTPQELTPQELTPQELTPQELTPQELTPQELTPQELTPQELTPQELTPQELTPQELTPPLSSQQEEKESGSDAPISPILINPLLSQQSLLPDEQKVKEASLEKQHAVIPTTSPESPPPHNKNEENFSSIIIESQKKEPPVSSVVTHARPRVTTLLPLSLSSNTITLSLDGEGWIFRSDLATPGSWEYIERIKEPHLTLFRFHFPEPGSWTMVFERQDLSKGTAEQVDKIVQVGKEAGPFENKEIQPDLTARDKSENLLSPQDRETLAQTALALGLSDEAIALWEQNAHQDDLAGSQARTSLIKQAAQKGDIPILNTWLPRYMEENPDTTLLEDVLDTFDKQGGYKEEKRHILEKLYSGNSSPRRPEWLYRLARLLEEPHENRNLDRARLLYEELLQEWPLSSWYQLAKDRLIWLQRHYYRIR